MKGVGRVLGVLILVAAGIGCGGRPKYSQFPPLDLEKVNASLDEAAQKQIEVVENDGSLSAEEKAKMKEQILRGIAGQKAMNQELQDSREKYIRDAAAAAAAEAK
ncbi:MAG: hypothetical protein ACRC1K_05185 [Planctomycetia bacterium]